MRIGYIGLGAMGGALARHLIGKFALSVFDLNEKTVSAFVELGATAAATPAELARNSDVVLLCLPRSSDVQAVLFGANGVADGPSAPGKIVIHQSVACGRNQRVRTSTRRDGRRIVRRTGLRCDGYGHCRDHFDHRFGPHDAFQKTLPVLHAISPNVFHCGERVGNGQTMKTVNNMMNVSCRLATLEVVAMGRKFGLPLELMTEAITQRQLVTTPRRACCLPSRKGVSPPSSGSRFKSKTSIRRSVWPQSRKSPCP